MRQEFLPLYNAHTTLYLPPSSLYPYISTVLTTPTTPAEQITASLVLDVACSASPHTSSSIDVKPLLPLLETAPGLKVYTTDIVSDASTPPVLLQHTLQLLYDITDYAAFLAYVDTCMAAVEIEYDDRRGVEVIFVLRETVWEDWMGVWSEVEGTDGEGIPLELADRVMEWGRGAGMGLGWGSGSYLTVNYRRAVGEGEGHGGGSTD